MRELLQILDALDGRLPSETPRETLFERLDTFRAAADARVEKLRERLMMGEEFAQRLRDEAHRFAIIHQRTRRKRDIASVLGEIPGLGPSRVKRLLTHFGSVSQLRQAKPDAIAAVRGVGPGLAQTVFAHLHPDSAAPVAEPRR
jgi:excinuclease UvrABC nuclease subunit